jgi:hypothetical protein
MAKTAMVKGMNKSGAIILIPKRINREANIPVLKVVWLSGYTFPIKKRLNPSINNIRIIR